MDSLADCRERVFTTGTAGVSVFTVGEPAQKPPPWLEQLAAGTQVAGEMTLYVLAGTESNVELRDYLSQATRMGIDVVVGLVDPPTVADGVEARGKVVDDLGRLKDAQAVLGVPVMITSPQSDPDGRVMSVTGLTIAKPGQMPDQYRVVSADSVAEREAARAVLAATEPSGLDRMREFLAEQPPSGNRAMLGAIHAGFGDVLGDTPLPELVESTRPLTAADVATALGASDQSLPKIGSETVIRELTSGAARAALVHGYRPGSTVPETLMLVKDGDVFRWVDPAAAEGDDRMPVASFDGAEDPRTALLEQPATTTLLFDADMRPYDVPAPEGPHLGTPLRVEGGLTLVGQWPQLSNSVIRTEVLNASTESGLAIAVDVRRTRDGLLDPLLKTRLDAVLRAHPGLPVIATEHVDELDWFIRVQNGRALIVPVLSPKTPSGHRWEVREPMKAKRKAKIKSSDTLTEDLFTSATNTSWSIGPQLDAYTSAWLSFPTWKDAERHFDQHRERLGTPETAAMLARHAAAHDKHAALADPADPSGTSLIKDNPFYLPDRTSGGFAMLSALAVEDETVPAGVGSVSPQSDLMTTDVPPVGQRFDLSSAFGFLTDRPVGEGTLSVAERNMLWLRELYRLLVDAIAAGENVDHTVSRVLALATAKGELPGERADRAPGDKEINRALVNVMRAFIAIAKSEMDYTSVEHLIHGVSSEYSEDGMEGRTPQLTAVDCLDGTQRVGLHYLINNLAKLSLPTAADELENLRAAAMSCGA